MKSALHLARKIKACSKSTFIHLLLSKIDQQAAPKKFTWRNYLFKNFPNLFKGNPAFEAWGKAYYYFIANRQAQIKWLDLKDIPVPKSLPSKKIAIHAHIYYSDLASELAQLLIDFPAPYDLLISTPHADDEQLLHEQFGHLPNLDHLEILITPNRGRDVGPMLYGFGQRLLSYDYFAHIHTKKSIRSNDIGNAWRSYLWDGLLNHKNDNLLKIFGLLERFGLVYPQRFSSIDVIYCQWGNNLGLAQDLCNSLHIPKPSPGYIEFPVGTMFWANTQALKPLLQHSFTLDDFSPEQGQTDNTLIHAIERLITHIALTQDFSIGVLSDARLQAYYP